jgi:uncharacterized protein YcgI (DUF1989 family)
VFRIVSVEGPQVGDLNLWNAHDLGERFFSGKTRAFHGMHVSTGDRLWSTLPALRPMATITYDTLGWYGWDADGGGIHDVIGTRCDPYTNVLLKGAEYHHCCHSNLTRALAAHRQMPLAEAEPHVHDVLNVFMCTGFTRDTHQYFMKASPVRPGDFIEFFAEIDLLAALSACPGGDCSATHSSDTARCYPLKIEIYRPRAEDLAGWQPAEPNRYSRSHGAGKCFSGSYCVGALLPRVMAKRAPHEALGPGSRAGTGVSRNNDRRGPRLPGMTPRVRCT